MKQDTEIRRYGRIAVIQHWLNLLIVLGLSVTGLFLVRDWFIHEFHIYGAEMYVPTPDFASPLHRLAAFSILILGAFHLVVHGGQKQKPLLPKRSMLELRQALYSLLYLAFLTRKQERGSGSKYLKSQRIIYAFTIYVLGLAAITGFLLYFDILGEHMLNVHVMAGVLVLLVVVHRMALVARRHDRVAIRCVLSTGTMPSWYVKKNHKIWYEDIMGRGASEIETPVSSDMKKAPPKPEGKEGRDDIALLTEDEACLLEG